LNRGQGGDWPTKVGKGWGGGVSKEGGLAAIGGQGSL